MSCSVLIAEDDANFRQLLAFILKRQGYTVDVAEDGPQTLERIKARDYHFVLLDYHIPGLDGAAVAEQAGPRQSDGEAQNLIAITGDPEGLQAKAQAAEKFQAILPKPLVMEDLMGVIGKLKSGRCEPSCINAAPKSGFEHKRVSVKVFPDFSAPVITERFEALINSLEESPQGIILAPGFDLHEVRRFRARGEHHLLPIIDFTGQLDDIGVDLQLQPLDAEAERKMIEVMAEFYRKRQVLPAAIRHAMDDETRLLSYLYVRGLGLRSVCVPDQPQVYQFSQFVPQVQVRETADRLVEQGLLRREFVDRVHVCTSCGSARTNVREECSSCRSANLEEVAIVHHFACAYQGPPSDFRQQDGSLVCPKCQVALLHYGTDYDRPGKIHQCRDCGHSGSELLVGFKCFDCGAHYDGETMPAVDHYNYELAEKGIEFLETGQSNTFAAAGPFMAGVLPLEIVWEVLALSRSPKPPQFLLGEIHYGNAAAIEQTAGPMGLKAVREIVRERLRSFIGDGGVVASGRDFDYFLVPDTTPERFKKDEPDLIRWCVETLAQDPDLQIKTYNGAGFLLPPGQA